jgi:hypothetical protein
MLNVMGVPVPFTGNVSDLGNANGFQWRFVCNRCGNGFESPFEQNLTARGKGLLRMAGDLFGGPVENLSRGVDDVNAYGYGWGAQQSATKDRAFARAVERVRSNFRQCRGCGHWVCEAFCWNEQIGQCQQCSPLIQEEIARAQGDAQRNQFRQKASEQDWTRGRDFAQQPRLRCNTCGAFTTGGRFCQQCGQALQVHVRCTRCGVTAQQGAMYCANCGTQL